MKTLVEQLGEYMPLEKSGDFYIGHCFRCGRNALIIQQKGIVLCLKEGCNYKDSLEIYLHEFIKADNHVRKVLGKQ